MSSTGVQGNGQSFLPSISVDGRFVVFDSFAANLVAGDDNGLDDVFVHDRQNGTTTRVSVDSAGAEADFGSRDSSISADGRFVSFNSDATNLVAGDMNGVSDVFVHDRDTGGTERVSVDSAGVEGNGSSGSASISADGRYVAFSSTAANLVASDTNGRRDIFASLNPLSPAASCNGQAATIVGTGGADLLTGTFEDDVILGLGGAEVIMGLGGNDTICGGPGADILDGDFGDDWMSGGFGPDKLRGGFGRDTMMGNAGRDLMIGGEDNDFMLGGGTADQAAGGPGDDIMFGGPGQDRLLGGDGDDILYGHTGDDELDCGLDSDIADGGPGTGDGAYANCELQVGVEVALP